ncbi:MAG TPA: YceI family protein [Dehalococcoidia bacterium]|nr:YceI family protein [Dehalococcoidia bacterium]
MKRWLIFGGGAIGLVAVAIVAVVVIQLLRSDDPNLATSAPLIDVTASSDPSGASGAAAGPSGSTGSDAGASSSESLPAGVHHFVIDPSQSQAKFVVEETLRGLDSNAVGTTAAINGGIYLTDKGLYKDLPSKFTIDLGTLKTDESMRDRFIKQNTLQTSKYPDAVFTIESVDGFPAGYTQNEQIQLTLNGTLSVHGVDKPVTWTVLARQAGDTLTATADTDINFTDFGMSPPNVQIAKAKNAIHLQVVMVAKEPA